MRIPGPERRSALLQTSDGEWDRRHDQAIDRAVDEGARRGAFDDLRGKGRPLQFRPEEGLATQSEDWLSNHLLANAGYRPPWVRVGRSLEQARARAAALQQAWRETPVPDRAALESRLTAAWEAENALIRRWNAEVPHPTLQRYPLPLARRWERLRADAAQDPAPPRPSGAPTSVPTKEPSR